jgi:energy-coupling factor transporter ATP-binding protein EcfA2
MTDVRLQITEALKSLIHRQRGRDFQWLAVHLAKTKWPELEATHEQADGGEDATSFFVGADGKRRTLACSLTGTLRKVREDAERQKQRGVDLDVLVFATPVPVTNLEVTAWRDSVQKEFGHDLHVIHGSELVTMLEQPANAWMCERYLDVRILPAPELADIEKSGVAAARTTLAAWQSEYGHDPAASIDLTLVKETQTEPVPITLAELANTLVEHDRILITGPPGAGKSTTLLQLAEALLDTPGMPIPFLVSLPGWAASGADFAFYFEQRLERLGVKSSSLRKLLDAGRVAILLNGWNEVPEDVGSQKAGAQLKDFAIANRKAAFVISARETHVAPPIGSLLHVSINPLSKEQQMLVIKRAGLIDPSILVGHLENNPVMAEVVQTPLFLAVMIDLTRRGASLPTTRGGIFKSFVEGVETSAEHAAALSRSQPK